MKEKNLLTEERKRQGLSMLALSKEAGVAYTTIWSLENGLEKRVSVGLKEKIAHALKKNIWVIFPDLKGEAFLMTLESFTGGLGIKEEEKSFYQEVLLQMTLDELSKHLFRTGTLPEDAKKIVRKFAKKYGVKSP